MDASQHNEQRDNYAFSTRPEAQAAFTISVCRARTF
jgi:hypothetical protein